jgi:hypothetical protein
MTNHPSKSSGNSQNAIILRRLQRSAGEWVPMPLLRRLSRSAVVHSRIADLRKRGLTIDQRNLHFGRKVCSEYMLVA